MSDLRFRATIGEDRVIRPPDGIDIPPGEVEVLVHRVIPRPEPDPSDPDPMAQTRAWLLAIAARAEQIEDELPSDMAENHNHYAHGAPKR